jgi:hypothetical protein
MKLKLSIFLLVGSIVAHALALYTGLYEAQMRAGFVWFDNVLHVCVGAGFGLLWLWLVDRMAPRLSGVLRILTTVVFVLAMAVSWELFEVGFYMFFNTHALGLKVYAPTFSEALSDSLSNMGGVIALLVILSLYPLGESFSSQKEIQ